MLPFVRMFDYGNIAPSPAAIKKLVAGYNWVMVLGSNGKLYTRGNNSYGQLGVGDTTTRSTWSLTASDVADVWCGQYASMILKSDGTYQYAGLQYNVCMGTSSVNTWTSMQTVINQVVSQGTITEISLGNNFISILMSNGTIWNGGYNTGGQLGDGSSSNSLTTLVRATIPSGAVPTRIIAGINMCSFIAESGRLYYTGEVYGDTNSSSTVSSYNVFTLSARLPATVNTIAFISTVNGMVQGIARNKSTSVVSVYTGGDQLYGQAATGTGATTKILTTAVTNQPQGNILDIGYGYGYYSNFVITDTGVYVAGNNSATSYYGQLSTGSTTNVLTYTKSTTPDLNFNDVKIQSCYGKTYMTDGNKIYSSGTNLVSGGTASTVFVEDSPI
jgi:alpha-tubulin suppressor-like RCC1 family protein